MKKFLITSLKIVTLFMTWAILSSVVDIKSDNSAIWRFYAEMIPFVIIILLTFVFLWIEKGEIKIPIQKNITRGILVGVISGAIWIALPTVILYSTNQLLLDKNSMATYLYLWILSALINVAMQEILIRGYIYQLLKTRYNVFIAIFFTTALFTLLHGGAFEAGFVAVINVITMSLFMSALYESEDSIFAPILAHAIWNIIGAIILGGVGLAEDYPSIFQTIASNNTLLSGGVYKIEGSIVVTIINIIFTLYFCYRYRKQKSH